jgi:transcription elongation factor GreA
MSILDQPTRQLSASARARLEQEELTLVQRRAELIVEQSQAETGGDLIDQASVFAQQIEIEKVDNKLAHIRELLASTTVACGAADGSVAVGSVVTLRFNDGSTETYQVGLIEEQDADVVALTPTSPLGQALIGHRKGETLTYAAPAGQLTVEIVNVAAAA